jgi:hypothetical protein
MYENAEREGLKLLPGAKELNLAARRSAQDQRQIRVRTSAADSQGDLLHSSVILDKGSFLHPHNNPKFECARLGDDGRISEALPFNLAAACVRRRTSAPPASAGVAPL